MCYEIFGPQAHPEWFPTDYWVRTYPAEVVLYGLLEAAGKYRRTPGMTDKQIANFASVVMERKQRSSLTG
jgi:hypothetical protein